MADNGTQVGPISAAVGAMLGAGRGMGATTGRQLVLSGSVQIDGVTFTAEGLIHHEGRPVDVRHSVPLGDTVLVQTDDGQSFVCERCTDLTGLLDEDNLDALRYALRSARSKFAVGVDWSVDRINERVAVRGHQLYVADVPLPHLSVAKLDKDTYSIVCDRRFEHLCTRGELSSVGDFLGQCMAVAAGYTCCGALSRPKQRNPYGLTATATAPAPGEPDRRAGLLRDVLREAEHNPGHMLSDDLLEGIVHELDVAGPAVAAAAPSAAAVLDPDVRTIHSDISPVELIVFGLLTMRAPEPLHVEYIDSSIDLGQDVEDDLVFAAVDRLVERGLVAYEGGAGLVRLAGGGS